MKRAAALLLGLLLLRPLSLAAEFSEPYLERSATAEQWFFKELPRHIGNDFKEAFWNEWHLAGFAAGVGLTLGIHEADDALQKKFDDEDPLGGAKDVFNVMGNSLVLGGATLTATVVSKIADAPKATLTAGTMLEALGITYVLTQGLKFATGRERPDGSNSRSFPSGHASGSFALATVTQVFYGPLYGIPSYALAGVISLARLDVNKHFASDTAAGALLGTMIGLGTAQFHQKERRDLFVMPSATESGMMVNVVRLF